MFHQTGLTGLQRAATGQPAWGQSVQQRATQATETTGNSPESAAEDQATASQQLAELQQQAADLAAQLNAINKQIETHAEEA